MAGGISANSLGLISDAVHNFVDEATLLFTFYAYVQATKPASGRRTFGHYRMEVMAAWTNSGALILITLGLMATAIFRLIPPAAVQGKLMWLIGLVAASGTSESPSFFGNPLREISISGAPTSTTWGTP